jgi:hypothetical protein
VLVEAYRRYLSPTNIKPLSFVVKEAQKEIEAI